MKLKLPKDVCALDIETSKTSFKNPEQSKLAVAGIFTYKLKWGRYYARKYQFYLENQTDELYHFLKNYSGLIIGHNIFQFDYRVLSSYFPLNGIIEKTVDTLAMLFKKNQSRFTGLGLNDLSLKHFGTQKTIEGKYISKLWNAGQKRKIINYNKNDCKLTWRLWWHLVDKRYAIVNTNPQRMREEWYRVIQMRQNDLNTLIGTIPQLTHIGWLRMITKHNKILMQKPVDNYIRVNKVPKINCPRCNLGCLEPLDYFLIIEKIPNISKKLWLGYYENKWKASFCTLCEALIISGKQFYNTDNFQDFADYIHEMLDHNKRNDRLYNEDIWYEREDAWKYQ